MVRRYTDLNVVWQKERIILLRLVVAVSALLICWHRQLIDGFHSMAGRAEVRTLMNSRGKNSGRRYHVRGPLTTAQIEQELFGRPLNSGSVTGTPESTDPGKAAWEKMKSKYRDGDEFYFVNSDERSWSRLEGWRGYVLVRQDRVVDELTRFMN